MQMLSTLTSRIRRFLIHVCILMCTTELEICAKIRRICFLSVYGVSQGFVRLP